MCFTCISSNTQTCFCTEGIIVGVPLLLPGDGKRRRQRRLERCVPRIKGPTTVPAAECKQFQSVHFKLNGKIFYLVFLPLSFSLLFYRFLSVLRLFPVFPSLLFSSPSKYVHTETKGASNRNVFKEGADEQARAFNKKKNSGLLI